MWFALGIGLWLLSREETTTMVGKSMPGNVGPADIDAASRMIASENPSADEDVWAEQIHTQMREAASKGVTVYRQITAGKSYGAQGGRPVSTVEMASPRQRQFAARVLRGEIPSTLDGATKFFDPSEQDAVMAQIAAYQASMDKHGFPPPGWSTRKLARTKQLISVGYKSDSDGIRERWAKKGRLVGIIGPVEFWT